MSNPPFPYAGYGNPSAAQQAPAPVPPPQQQQQTPPPQHKPPTWGSWLKAHWLKATVGTAAALYGTVQVLETNYEYRMNNGNHAAGYVLYLAEDTYHDGAWALGKVSDGLAWSYAKVTGTPTAGARQQVIAIAVPPSLAHMGWDSPPAGSKLEAYKAEALRQASLSTRVRDEPGSPYYRANNMVVLIRDVFDKFEPGSKKSPPLVDVRLFDAGGPTAPPGYNQYFMEPGSTAPRLIP